jgi:hypothetical protein
MAHRGPIKRMAPAPTAESTTHRPPRQRDADTNPSSCPRGVRSSFLRALGPALWPTLPETDNRPPDVGVGAAAAEYALDISPFKRRRESKTGWALGNVAKCGGFPAGAGSGTSLCVASRRFAYRKVREVPEWWLAPGTTARYDPFEAMSIDQIYEAIRALPVGEQLRLVERVVHEVAAKQTHATEPNELLGLFADDPELISQIGAEAIAERQSRSWRSGT